MEKPNVRRIALRLLAEWEEGDKYINLLLDTPRAAALEGEDRRFLTALLYGTVERIYTLDYRIDRLTRRGAARLAPQTRRLLLLGLYQLGFMEGVPDFAAIHETVKLAGNRGERGFVNAVLREAQRRPDLLLPPPRGKDPVAYLSVAYSFPPAIVRLFCEQYGEAMAEQLLCAFNRTAPLTLCVNTKRTNRAALLARLRESGYEAVPTPYAPTGIRLSGSENPVTLPGFPEGDFYVQDEASQIAVAALGTHGPAFVVDTCACPGGKSFGVAMGLDDGGRVLSLDLHESKLSLIRTGAARLGLTSITVGAHDGTRPDPALAAAADAVICDAPCSGLGVLGKKADLRYRGEGRLSELPPLQLAILSAAATYVRPGGTLLYTTCTLNEAENGGVCREFQKNNPEFIPVDFAVGDVASHGGSLTLLPPLHGTDGFFLAKFIRKQDAK